MSFLECFSLCHMKSPRQQKDVDKAHQIVGYVSNKPEGIVNHEVSFQETIYVTKNA